MTYLQIDFLFLLPTSTLRSIRRARQTRTGRARGNWCCLHAFSDGRRTTVGTGGPVSDSWVALLLEEERGLLDFAELVFEGLVCTNTEVGGREERGWVSGVRERGTGRGEEGTNL